MDENKLKEYEDKVKEYGEKRDQLLKQHAELLKLQREKQKETLMETIQKMFSIREDTASNDEIRDRLLSGGKITGTNLVVMVCAILIASVGLNTNSVAVIIGAMLISPLMGSILAVSYGTVSNDLYLVRKHATGFVVQVVVSILASMIYFLLSPVKDPTEQLLARTTPNFYDVIIAIAGGVAGIIGQTRQDKSNNIIPGVAIATALMPPLCTCGYSIAVGNLPMFGGAFGLFAINAYFIFFSSNAILSLLKTPKLVELTDEDWKKLSKKMFRNLAIIFIPVIAIIVFIALH